MKKILIIAAVVVSLLFSGYAGDADLTDAVEHDTTYKTNGKFKKDKTYNVTPTVHQEKITEISETICGEIK